MAERSWSQCFHSALSVVHPTFTDQRERRRGLRGGRRSQCGGGDLLHPPPLGQSGAAHRLQDRGDVPVEGGVGGGHCTLEGEGGHKMTVHYPSVTRFTEHLS